MVAGSSLVRFVFEEGYFWSRREGELESRSPGWSPDPGTRVPAGNRVGSMPAG